MQNEKVGISLSESLAKFSNNKLWDEYITHLNKPVQRVDPISTLPKNSTLKDRVILFQGITSGYFNNKNKEKELFNKLVRQFKLKFDSNKLFAYGYSIPRNAKDKPNLIPFDVIVNGEINWDDSSIIGNGLEFVGVRVFKEPLIIELNELPNSIGIEKESVNKAIKGKGRPSNKGLIKSYYLKEKTNIDFSKSKNEIYEALEKTIGENEDIQFNKETNHYVGLGYTAINNSIGPLVDKEKKRLAS